MKKREIIKSILLHLQMSTMTAKEKSMWTVLLPTLGDAELKKLNDSLKKEVDQLMDLYLKKLKIDA